MDRNIDFTDMRSFQEEMINKLISDLNNKKDLLIKERLSALNLLHLLPTEKTKFPKVLCEQHPDEEIWFVDNGTKEGLRIITFKNYNYDNPQYSIDPEKTTSIGITLDYY